MLIDKKINNKYWNTPYTQEEQKVLKKLIK